MRVLSWMVQTCALVALVFTLGYSVVRADDEGGIHNCCGQGVTCRYVDNESDCNPGVPAQCADQTWNYCCVKACVTIQT